VDRISYNVNAANVGDKDYFLQHMAKLQPTSVLIMDGLGLAGEVISATEGQTRVIHRTWEKKDADHWNRYTPDEYFRRVTNNGKNRRDVIYYVCNEPGPHGRDIKTMCDWFVEVGRRGEREDYHFALGNMGSAIWNPPEIESGYWDDLLGWSAHWATTGRHWLDWHEYSIFPPYGVGYWPKEFLLDIEKVQPGNWPYWTGAGAYDWDWDKVKAAHAESQIRAQAVEYPPNWHILRYRWWILYAESIGIGKFKSFITECFWDRMPDLTPEENHIYDRLERKFGMPLNEYGEPYPHMRGQHTYLNVWKTYYPHLSFDEAMFMQMLWVEEVYPKDEVEGFNIFTWSEGASDWDKLHGFNMSTRRDFHRLLERERYSPTPPPIPPDPPTPEPEPEPDPDPPVPVPEDPVSPVVFWTATGVLVFIFVIMGILSIIARINLLTAMSAGEISMEVPSLAEAANILLLAIAGILQGGLAAPVTTPIVNLLKLLTKWFGLENVAVFEILIFKGNWLNLYVAVGVTALVWASQIFGVESQVDTVLGSLAEIIPLILTLLGSFLGAKGLFAVGQRQSIPLLGYTRTPAEPDKK